MKSGRIRFNDVWNGTRNMEGKKTWGSLFSKMDEFWVDQEDHQLTDVEEENGFEQPFM